MNNNDIFIPIIIIILCVLSLIYIGKFLVKTEYENCVEIGTYTKNNKGLSFFFIEDKNIVLQCVNTNCKIYKCNKE